MPRIKSLASSTPAPHPNDVSTDNTEQDTSPPATPVPVPPAPIIDLDRYTVARPIRVEPPGGGVPFVQVYHPSCRRMQAITRAYPQTREGDVLLIDGETILPVLRLHMIHAAQYYTRMAVEDGRLLEVSRTRPVDGSSFLEEHIESLLLAYTPERLLTAKATWRKTRAPLAKVMAAELRKRENRWLEFVGSPRTENRTSGTGIAYSIVTADVAPINADDARRLQAWFAEEKAQQAFARVKADYEQRLESLEAMAK
jgi:hypothetical protein